MGAVGGGSQKEGSSGGAPDRRMRPRQKGKRKAGDVTEPRGIVKICKNLRDVACFGTAEIFRFPIRSATCKKVQVSETRLPLAGDLFRHISQKTLRMHCVRCVFCFIC
jgi:hypothetical protein